MTIPLLAACRLCRKYCLGKFGHSMLLITTLVAADFSTALARGNLKSSSRIKETPSVAVVQKDPARGFYEKTYNSANLDGQFKKRPAKAPTLGDDSRRVLGETAKRVTDQNSTTRNHVRVVQLYERAAIPTLEATQMRQAAGKLNEEYKNPTQPIEVLQHMSGHYKQELNDMVVNKLPYWQKITGDWNFSFGFGGTTEPAKAPVAMNKSVQYGLVLKDVRASDAKAMQAALGSEDMSDWESAPSATTEWTIGPITPGSEIQLRQVAVPVFVSTEKDSAQYVGMIKAYQVENQKLDETLVTYINKHLVIPKPQFKGKAKLRATPGVAAPGTTKMPGLEIVLTQIENYYSLTYLTKDTLAKDGISHSIRVPIVGTFAINRKFDEHGKPVETIFSDVLVKPGLPVVNVTCNNQNGSFKTELVHSANAKTVKFVSDGPKGCPITDRRIKHDGEKYSIEYNMNF